jgi:hypothetical protein
MASNKWQFASAKHVSQERLTYDALKEPVGLEGLDPSFISP